MTSKYIYLNEGCYCLVEISSKILIFLFYFYFVNFFFHVDVVVVVFCLFFVVQN